jgi:hypothetical protein
LRRQRQGGLAVHDDSLEAAAHGMLRKVKTARRHCAPIRTLGKAVTWGLDFADARPTAHGHCGRPASAFCRTAGTKMSRRGYR